MRSTEFEALRHRYEHWEQDDMPPELTDKLVRDLWAALLTRRDHPEPTPIVLESLEGFLEAIIAQHGCNDHAWLTRCAIDNLKELKQLATRRDAPQEQHEIERRIWQERETAFKAYYEGQSARQREPNTEYTEGLAWATLKTLDKVLSIFRAVLDGTPGTGVQQMAAQMKRVGRDDDPAKEPGWQAIETAPRDGTKILAGYRHELYSPEVVEFSRDHWRTSDGEAIFPPQLWIPIPAPPVAAKEQQ